MAWVKQGIGRIDSEDYFLTGSLTDFLGGGVCSRKDDLFEVKKGEIKRRFPYQEFAAVVKLEESEGSFGSRCFFVETTRGDTITEVGISQSAVERSSNYWRITCSDGFIQTFQSHDGQTWNNEGGYVLKDGEQVAFLGFSVSGDATLCFSSCTCYSSPFLFVQNFAEGFMVKLLDDGDQVLKTELFGGNMIARICMDSSLIGKLNVYSSKEELVAEGALTEYEPGDVWLWSDRTLELRYNGAVLDYGPTNLQQKEIHTMTLKNTGDAALQKLKVQVSGIDADKVQLSWDGTEYVESLTLEELQGKIEKVFFMKIASTQVGFQVMDFAVEIY